MVRILCPPRRRRLLSAFDTLLILDLTEIEVLIPKFSLGPIVGGTHRFQRVLLDRGVRPSGDRDLIGVTPSGVDFNLHSCKSRGKAAPGALGVNLSGLALRAKNNPCCPENEHKPAKSTEQLVRRGDLLQQDKGADTGNP